KTMVNESHFGGFILLGFQAQPQLEMIISGVVFLFYTIALMGNMAIVLLSLLDDHLQTPMYFFLRNLAILDLCYTTNIVPQMLANMWGKDKRITFGGCAFQLFTDMVLCSVECILLAVMSYDRFNAVCKPLHYMTVMNPQLCRTLVAMTWGIGVTNCMILSPYAMKNRKMVNDSHFGGFILLGFPGQPQLEMIISGVVFLFYTIALMGNMAIILLPVLDERLQTPMYFFLRNLAILDLCYTTNIVPQMLANIWGKDKKISYGGCAFQLFTDVTLCTVECMLLAVMSYDRFNAVCKPLHYMTIMNPQLCRILVAMTWGVGVTNCMILSPHAMSLPRCGNHHLDHYFCEISAMVKIACVDTTAMEETLFVLCFFIFLTPLFLILISYGFIAVAVLRIKSAAGRQKAFGTCSSHL
ncbi:OR2W1 protein, partial [Crocuta crocuta]